ncbi:MAG: tRNA (adenosine(37)-N6)-dimethylallyltransferase MiaA [Granulosicoccus sp.]
MTTSANPLAANKSAVIFLMGATACGKTELSFSLAESLNAEIISVDSALVYRGMDVGTAKPSVDERSRVPHYLIDVCDPWDSYSAARFCTDALATIDDIHSRGKRALLVGGTMLYFKALEEGLAKLPDADAAVRKALVKQAQVNGWSALHEELQVIDPVAAKRIHPNDPQRLQRALEVYRITGVAMSELQANTTSPLQLPPIKFALAPESRSWLHERIALRFTNMLDNGFMQEMQSLRQDQRIHAELPAMRSVGYRQAWEHMDTGSADDAEWIAKAIAATRQLAKRQLTWIRGTNDLTTVSCDTLSLQQQLELIRSTINNHQTKPRDSSE